MVEKLSLRNLDLKNKRVLTRVDFNVPFDKQTISDDTRIRSSLPTIQYIIDHGGIAVLMSHLGRPKGQPDPECSLAPCARHLSTLIGRPVKMAQDCCGIETQKLVASLKPGEILLLENLRFHLGEEKPHMEADFASALSELGDVYVNDAFGCAHREHASITEVPKFFPGKSAMGFLLEKEINYLGKVLLNPSRPFHVILGGSKISTKFKVIKAFMQKADVLLIGGAMAFNFLKVKNISVGDSLVENDFLGVTRELMDVHSQSRCQLLLPVDIVINRGSVLNDDSRIISVKDGIPAGFQGVDIGPETIKIYKKALEAASTIFWNGPMGIFESPPFDSGTNAIAQVLANLPVATTIIGGGDSVAAVRHAGLESRMSHLSTGGGASLEFIELQTLPGVEALTNETIS